MPLATSRYGKGRVRVARLHREGPRHTLRDLSVKVLLTGDFGASYTAGDNRTVVATDTIKNIVHVLAHENLAAENEVFAGIVARFFLDRYPQVEMAEVWTRETSWNRISAGAGPHDHGFVLGGNGTPTVHVSATREKTSITSGVSEFTLMKTTEAGWSDFHTDEYRTLPDTTDRIVATSMVAEWPWTTAPAAYEAANAKVLEVMLGVFLDGYSPGVQNTMYMMGEAVLAAVPEIASVSLAMPNKHYIPLNLKAFGRENKGEVFLPTDEPHGQIEATITRG